MKIYNPGTLVILKNFQDNVYTGIILKHIMHKDWWGGGYYEFIWTPEIYDPSGFYKLGFQQIVDWQNRKEIEVYPIE